MTEPGEGQAENLRKSAHTRVLGIVVRIAGIAAFIAAVYFSGRLGVDMAKNRLPDQTSPNAVPAPGEPLSVGNSGDPLYLAQSPTALRNFFSAYPTTEARASADLTGLGVRRLRDSMEMKTLRAEADAVEVMVSSGAIAGGVYWIHYTQLPDPSSFRPIISPLPEDNNL